MFTELLYSRSLIKLVNIDKVIWSVFDLVSSLDKSNNGYSLFWDHIRRMSSNRSKDAKIICFIKRSPDTLWELQNVQYRLSMSGSNIGVDTSLSEVTLKW